MYNYNLGSGEVAIDVKGTSRVEQRDLKPLKAFAEEYSPGKKIVICNEKKRRIHGDIIVMPWKEFLCELWEGKIIS